VKTRADVLAAFPPLANDPHFDLCSDFDRTYNCFAFAVGDTTSRWDPAPTTAPTRAGLYWPDGVPLLYTLSAYLAAFATHGYERCESGEPEPGSEKIALYLGADGVPAHAARQKPDGTWMSKLGAGVDIRHGTPEVVGSGNDDPPDGVGNTLNGEPTVFLKRPKS
jgi:hypothetical protein